MRIITKRRIIEFIEKYPDCNSSLHTWYSIIANSEYNSFNELRQTFPAADMVNNLIVFNIGGNKYRLIAAIHFNKKIVYIRHILTHNEYDRNKWK